MTDFEINKFLAEKLMGYQVNEEEKCDITGVWVRENEEQEWWSWNPCFFISQALGKGKLNTVVGKMAELGWEFSFDNEDHFWDMENEFFAEFIFRTGKFISFDGDDDIPSRAICKAAYKALTDGKSIW